MRIKNMSKYIFMKNIHVYGIYACIMLFLIFIGWILSCCVGSSSGTSLGGTESGTMLCLFITAITFYRENISMTCQNGISRKSYIISNVASLTLTAAAAAAGDTLISIIGNFVESHGATHFNSLYEEIFLIKDESYYDNMDNIITPSALDNLKMLVLYFSATLAAISIGLMIASIIYRLPKALKIIVPVAFYIFSFAVVPVIAGIMSATKPDSLFAKLFNNMIKFLDWVTANFARLSVTLIIYALIMFLISALIIRRTPINDKKE